MITLKKTSRQQAKRRRGPGQNRLTETILSYNFLPKTAIHLCWANLSSSISSENSFLIVVDPVYCAWTVSYAPNKNRFANGKKSSLNANQMKKMGNGVFLDGAIFSTRIIDETLYYFLDLRWDTT